MHISTQPQMGTHQLEALAIDLAGRPELWSGRIRHDAGQRVYEELFLNEHAGAWLICWMPGHDTGFHDHDLSAGAVAVLAGAVREQRLALGPEPVTRVFEAGATFAFEASQIHRVEHWGDEPAVTLHVYSPPLSRMGAYTIGENGVLARHAMSHADELKPLAADAPRAA